MNKKAVMTMILGAGAIFLGNVAYGAYVKKQNGGV